MLGDEIPSTIVRIALAEEITGIKRKRLLSWIRAGKIVGYLQRGTAGLRVYYVDLSELVDRLNGPPPPTKDYALRVRTAAQARQGRAAKRAALKAAAEGRANETPC